MFTYIVEDKSKKITGLVCYFLPYVHQTRAHISTVVSTQSPVKHLIVDALVCARTVSIHQNNIKSSILTSLSFVPSATQTLHFYNYRYHDTSQAKVWTL